MGWATQAGVPVTVPYIVCHGCDGTGQQPPSPFQGMHYTCGRCHGTGRLEGEAMEKPGLAQAECVRKGCHEFRIYPRTKPVLCLKHYVQEHPPKLALRLPHASIGVTHPAFNSSQRDDLLIDRPLAVDPRTGKEPGEPVDVLGPGESACFVLASSEEGGVRWRRTDSYPDATRLRDVKREADFLDRLRRKVEADYGGDDDVSQLQRSEG